MMSVTTTLPVSYHQQDTDYYCGAACAQMGLDAVGAGVLDQDDLYLDCHGQGVLDPASGWSTAPDGLTWTLNDRSPSGFSETFELAAVASEAAVSRRICWAIHKHQVAPVALVNGWQHWIVVRGYTSSQHPTSAVDTSYTIDGFDVHDPSPPLSDTGAPPPPHAAGDACGSGGLYGIANIHVSYTAWQGLMTGVPSGYWQGKFVAVDIGEQPECPPVPKPQEQKRQGKPDGKSALKPAVPSVNNALVTPRRAARLAKNGLRAHGLHARSEWGRALAEAKPVAGRLVQRLDREDSFYSLVEFRSARGTVAIVSVDARSGEYLQSGLIPRASKEFFPMSLDDAKDLIVGRRIELADNGGRLLIRKEALSQYPLLVWQPCRQSLSPFYPFYMFTVGRDRIYVRIDGAIFSSLTTDAPGI